MKKNDSATSKNSFWPKEDEFYTIFYAKDFHPELTNLRPSKSDTTIQFCIPVAFTLLENDSIDGLFVVDGKIMRSSVNHHLGGGMLFSKNNFQIIATNDGKILTRNFIDSISKLQLNFFQQIQLVRNEKALEFNKDQKLFQRRALVFWKSDPFLSIIESKNAITLQEFANDLAEMKIDNAIYTDMGSFDEGWYRTLENKAIHEIGTNRSQTDMQSNWLIFRR